MERYQEPDGKLLVNVYGTRIYENDIEEAIAAACEEFQIEDLKKEGQQRWKAVCMYVGHHCFPVPGMLKQKELENNNSCANTTNNTYNFDLINQLFEYYLYISGIYNKIPSYIAFAHFINIPADTIQEWTVIDVTGDRKVSKTGHKLAKRLKNYREDALKDKALDNGNVMGVFQVGRLEHGWDMPGVRNEDGQRRILTVDDLPKLGQNTSMLTDNRQQADDSVL